MEQTTHLMSLVAIALLAILAVRLVRTRLHGRYPAFFFWICFVAARNATLELIVEYKRATFYLWLVTEPLLVLGFIVVVFEIYSLALQAYSGIQTYSKGILTLALVVASAISVVSIFPDLQFNSANGDEMFLLVNVIRRGVYTSLLAFLILLVSFISVFPIKLSRNTILHVILFSLLFLVYAATILVMNLQGYDIIPVINLIASIVDVTCFSAWILFLAPSGEIVQTSVRSGMSADDAADLLKKLKAVNDSLSSSRKQL